MAACTQCRTELAAIGCERCSPSAIDASIFDAIEGAAQWPQARAHRVVARMTKNLLVFGGLFFLVFLLFASERIDGKAIAMVVIGALFVVGALWFQLGVRLEPLAAVVLGAAALTTTDARGRTNTSYSLHLQTRAGRRSLATNHEAIHGLAPGAAVIAFARWGHLDDVWPHENPA